MAGNTVKSKLILTAEDNTERVMRRAQQRLRSFEKAALLTGAAVGGLGFAKLATDMVRTTAEFQRLNASLVTVTGSQEKANKVFKQLQEFAATTPFQLQEVVTAYNKLSARGIEASRELLTSLGNTAAGMGKSLDQMVEAVADATVGEFERLKEFGIKASSEGENVAFTFRGVTTTVRKESSAITSYLQQLGNTEFAGGMLRQMDTLGGAFSNLQDAYSKLLFEMGSGETGQVLIDSINELTATLSNPQFVQAMANFASGAANLVRFGLEGFVAISDFIGGAAARAGAAAGGGIIEDRDYTTRLMDAEARLEDLLKIVETGRKNLGGDLSRVPKNSFLAQALEEIPQIRQQIKGLRRLADQEAAQLGPQLPAGGRPSEPAAAAASGAAGVPGDGFAPGGSFSLTGGGSGGLGGFSLAGNGMTFEDNLRLDSAIRLNEGLANIEAMRTDNLQLETDSRISIMKQEMAAKQAGMAFLQNLSSLAQGNSEKMFKVAQFGAISETAVNTFKAAQGAYAALAPIPIIGPALGAAAALAATEAGRQNILKIKNTKYGNAPSATATYDAGGTGAGTNFGTVPVAQPNQSTGQPSRMLTINIGKVVGEEEEARRIGELIRDYEQFNNFQVNIG